MSDNRGTAGPGDGAIGPVGRRQFLQFSAAAAGYGVAAPAWERFQRTMASGQWTPLFFSADELAAFRILADMVIPRDERSGSATDAGTVEYADFVLSESGDSTKAAWHEGFAWLDGECRRRFQQPFARCVETQRAQLVEDIAWPARAVEPFRTAAGWFNRVRDLVGSGFFSSEMGVRDLRYAGGVFNLEWRGAPDEALRELGVNYDAWDRRYGGQS